MSSSISSTQIYPKEQSKISTIKELFCGGINRKTKESSISDYFSKFGQISEIRLATHKPKYNFRGFCYFKYEDPAAYQKVLAVNEHYIDNKKVVVEIAFTKEESIQMLKDEKDRKVYVTNLPWNLKDKVLQDYFSQFGPIKELKLNKQVYRNSEKCFAFVTYEEISSMNRAIVSEKPYIEEIKSHIYVTKAM